MAKNTMSKEEAEVVLGLKGYYDASDLKKAYREKIKENHPDAQPKDEISQQKASQATVKVNEANKVLTKYLKEFGTATAGVTSPYASSSNTSTNSSSTQQTYSQTQTNSAGYDNTWTSSTSDNTAPSNSQSENVEVSRKRPNVVLRAIRKVIAKFPYRIALLVFAMWIYMTLFGNNIMSPEVSDIATPEMLFMSLGFIFASFVNLIFGFMTDALRKSLLWAFDKLTGQAPKEPSIRYAIFGHLPYRLMFLGYAIWRYWDFAMFHVEDSGPLDWPWRCLVFGVAALNALVPIITGFIREVLAGDDTGGYDENQTV